MKKIYLAAVSLAFSGTPLAQNSDVAKERRQLIKNERAAYQKISAYNVNPNTQNYDLVSERLELELDPAVYNISGLVTAEFKAKESLGSIYFDLSKKLNVAEVIYHGQQASFEQLDSDELKITLPTAISAGTLDSLSIRYSGAPTRENEAFTTGTQSGTPILYTLSEPYGAKDWWPTKQSMNDKIDRLDILVTAPSQYKVASNGALLGETALSNGKTLTHWRTNYPIPAYLFAVGITNYVATSETIGTGAPFPFLNYLYPATASNASVRSNILWTKDAMALFEDKFGPYPYRNEKYGHAQFGYGGGMEHATMSFMGGFGKTIIAHELAHQWFGDKVTCATWNDIWLNEGFATFGEHLVNEKLLLNATDFQTYFAGQLSLITSQTGGSVYVSDGNLSNDNAVFSSRLSYAKGGYVVRMLRWVLGEESFYQGLKNYLSDPALAYGYASTEQLRSHLEAVSGKNLSAFFSQWIYGQGYPTYQIRWAQNGDKSVVFSVAQSSSHSSVSFFQMPVPVRLKGGAGEVKDVVLDNVNNNQIFKLTDVSFSVVSAELDPDRQIIQKNSSISADASLGTADFSAQNGIAIYPNPVKDILNIRGIREQTTARIISSDGRLIQTAPVSSESGIGVSALAKGVYYLILNDRKIKFIKE